MDVVDPHVVNVDSINASVHRDIVVPIARLNWDAPLDAIRMVYVSRVCASVLSAGLEWIVWSVHPRRRSRIDWRVTSLPQSLRVHPTQNKQCLDRSVVILVNPVQIMACVLDRNVCVRLDGVARTVEHHLQDHRHQLVLHQQRRRRRRAMMNRRQSHRHRRIHPSVPTMVHVSSAAVSVFQVGLVHNVRSQPSFPAPMTALDMASATWVNVNVIQVLKARIAAASSNVVVGVAVMVSVFKVCVSVCMDGVVRPVQKPSPPRNSNRRII